MFLISIQQYGNKENKIPLSSERDLDMLPSWEKDKYQPPVSAGEELKKSHASAPVPVVKDASEFRELTQVCFKRGIKQIFGPVLIIYFL